MKSVKAIWPGLKRLVFSSYCSVMPCKDCQVQTLLLVHFCQVMLIFVFRKLTILGKHLCKLTGDMCFAPIHMASKLQVCHLFY